MSTKLLDCCIIMLSLDELKCDGASQGCERFVSRQVVDPKTYWPSFSPTHAHSLLPKIFRALLRWRGVISAMSPTFETSICFLEAYNLSFHHAVMDATQKALPATHQTI